MGKSTRLVGKDELNLAELLNEITITRKSPALVLGEKHFNVVVNDFCETKLSHFDHYVQRNRNHVRVC
ncbi:MAG: hypothetical protein ACK521_12485, partial [bacterium]